MFVLVFSYYKYKEVVMIEVLTDTAETVLKRRYYLKDEEGNCIETWPDLCRRVAKHVANGDAVLEEEFFWMINDLYFLPNSPCIMNAGTEIGNLSACFVLPVEDSMEGIFDAIKWGAIVHKTGGGTGYSFSRLRAKNSAVKSTSGVASGPISFAEVFDSATNTIKQGGRRRGANMGVLRVDHGDIEEFITVKSDPNKLNNFNLSVAITDRFMEAVRAGEAEENRIFDLIVEKSHSNGEPGVIFIDTVNRANNTEHLGEFEATNPCQPYWTPVIKKGAGVVPFGTLNVGDVIWSKEGWTPVTMFESTGIKDVFGYSTTAGTFYSTDNHEVVSGGSKIEACNAESIDLCETVVDEEIIIDYQDVVDGLVIGDGTKHGKEGEKISLLCIGAKDQDYFEIIPEFIGNEYSKPGTYKIKTTISPDELPQTFERYVPERFLYASRSRISGFLRGIFSANGSIIFSKKTRRVQLKASSRTVIEQVQVMLLSLGIRSYVTTNKSKDVEFSNGIYKCKESYDINITSDIDIFYKLVGFIQKYKSDKLEEVINYVGDFKGGKRNYSIYKSEYVSTEEVFHITVDNKTHTYWSAGFDTGNCAEQPLLPFNSCSLGSINWFRFIKTVVPRTDDRDWPSNDCEIDWKLLEKIVRLATRFLDMTLDVNKFPLPQIAEETLKTRNIGLGPMGVHDTLIALELPYDSQAGRDMVAELMNFVHYYANDESVKMAEEAGPYPAYRVASTTPYRKNANLTTCAPTGTISMISDCSSGCEPLYSLVIAKRVMENELLTLADKQFEKVARREGFFSSDLMKRIAESGSVKQPDIPLKWQEIFKTARDITAEDHIRMQAVMQVNGNDSGVSKTINMPQSATKKDVRDAILLAYDLGCKGVAIFRDQCRANQVLNTVGNLDKPTATVSADGPVKQDLPDTLRARRYKLKLDDGENVYIIICFSEDGKPMEVFAKFPYDGRHEYREKSTAYTTVCRLVSLALRYSIPVEEVIKQLDKSSGSMMDLPAQLTKLLKTFLSETNSPYTVLCPECGEPTLVFEEGCQVCKSCGYSKCS